MMLPIIVILALTSHIQCQDNHYDQLLYVQDDYREHYLGPFELTSVLSGRPEYKHTWENRMFFNDSQWVITNHDGTTRCYNPRQDLTPPRDGWYWSDGRKLNIIVYTVPVTTPPPKIIIKSDSVPEITGIYSLFDKQLGYPSYTSSHAKIAVRDDGYGYHWFWRDSRTNKKVWMTRTVTYPPYTPADWGWNIEEADNKTIVLSGGLFCTAMNNSYVTRLDYFPRTDHFISKTDPQFCNRKPDCSNGVDEIECPLELGFIPMMFITIGIVGLGVMLFLVFRYFHIMDMQSTDIVVTMAGTNNTMEEQIIDKITIGMAFRFSLILIDTHFHI